MKQPLLETIPTDLGRFACCKVELHCADFQEPSAESFVFCLITQRDMLQHFPATLSYCLPIKLLAICAPTAANIVLQYFLLSALSSILCNEDTTFSSKEISFFQAYLFNFYRFLLLNFKLLSLFLYPFLIAFFFTFCYVSFCLLKD